MLKCHKDQTLIKALGKTSTTFARWNQCSQWVEEQAKGSSVLNEVQQHSDAAVGEVFIASTHCTSRWGSKPLNAVRPQVFGRSDRTTVTVDCHALQRIKCTEKNNRYSDPGQTAGVWPVRPVSRKTKNLFSGECWPYALSGIAVSPH